MAGEQWKRTSANVGNPGSTLAMSSSAFDRVGGVAGSLLNQIRADETEKSRLAQQALANQRAEEQLGFQRAAAQREADKATQDKLLGEALVQAQQNKTVGDFRTDVVTQGNEAEVASAKLSRELAEKANQRVQNRLASASENYTDLFEKYSNQKDATSAGGSGGLLAMGQGIGGLLTRPNTTNKYTPEQAHKLALRESGINAVTKAVDVPTVPELVKTVTKQTPITRDMTQKEWLNKSIDSIMNRKDLTGSTKLAAKKALEGESKSATFDQLFKVQKMQKEEQDAQSVGTQILKDLNKPAPKGMSGKSLERYAKQLEKEKKVTDPWEKDYGKVSSTMRAAGLDDKDQIDTVYKLAKEAKITPAEVESIINDTNVGSATRWDFTHMKKIREAIEAAKKR